LNHETGELVPGRCRATNLCRYCQKLYVIETVEMLSLDAMEHAPNLWAVLTAREHLTRKQTYRHLEQLREAVKSRWPDVAWFVQVEFQRRGALHLNLLVKGVPDADAERLHEALSSVWCRRVDAEPVGQWVGVVAEAEGVVRYLSKMLAHGLKAEQAPPIGWKGHRTSQSRSYLVRPASVMRVEARQSLRLKRLLYRGFDDDTAALELAAANATAWTLQYVQPATKQPNRTRPADLPESVQNALGRMERRRRVRGPRLPRDPPAGGEGGRGSRTAARHGDPIRL
jgi:hypothetical protein